MEGNSARTMRGNKAIAGHVSRKLFKSPIDKPSKEKRLNTAFSAVTSGWPGIQGAVKTEP
ncbi:hypothetical protein B4098_1001 [Heyndrickxia coagulans]|uniref:Uncharacterized protein n=1 Tax=Heyndrickxia coagulans TaxID=1398 RepID=A0A150KA63_HEYCO|nr:hypothetical protein B4098_1001 [Heyndrickxia coagulans]